MSVALVTGASTGIGYELARLCVADGHDTIIVANEPAIHTAAAELGARPVEADLATRNGAQAVVAALGGQDVDYLFLNAGTGLGHGFLDQDLGRVENIVMTNILGVLRLAHPLGRRMVARGKGRILITGSIVGYMPGAYQAVYSGSKAFLNSFSIALAEELKDTGVTVTCLMPGATETRFFERADMLDTPVGQARKDDPADVAKTGYQAMMDGRAQVTHGLKNKAQAAAAEILPAEMVAKLSTRMSKPKDE